MSRKAAMALNKCPKCHKKTWHFRLHMEFVVPGQLYGNLGRENRNREDVECSAAFWESASWECHNPKCMYTIRAPRPFVYKDVADKKPR